MKYDRDLISKEGLVDLSASLANTLAKGLHIKSKLEGKNNSDGLRHGLWRRFFQDGSICWERNFKDGNLDGSSKWWYSSGDPMVFDFWVNDRLEGEMIDFDEADFPYLGNFLRNGNRTRD